MKPLYRGSYPSRSKRIREDAYANPGTICWRCTRTYAEAVKLWGPKGAAWQAGHKVDGHHGSPLAAEHAYCNAAEGAKRGHRRRAKRQNPRSPNA
jgi:hypothetical protein